ncbi:MmcQ/YjbR family DNA-binding protein [Cellulomonas sp. JZ18]|uniref:MmcQ/YjbR family DNA-binding protein n=1 Tax=Cellulomonas sp. JZ18 TaxID=2654191 RepID=UPI0012D4B6D2|nr:MmcQ/YjbR family DNA-binding protein [Cellulomonas sp. JZ18]QGQ18973.1 MmcQ/YjbR family DNA-binding protein [Cellulomonas sp. JZ18]
MHGDAVRQTAVRTAADLPGATHEHPFGPEWDVFKVAGKVFLLLTDVPGEPVAVLKCDPEDALALREQHAGITPGYHMNKRHWITVHGRDDVTADLVQELVRESYLLVRAGLPRDRRPVVPDDLGRSG